jgi:hypothetical protein
MMARTKQRQATLRTNQGILLTGCGCLLIAAIFMSRHFGQWHSWHPASPWDTEASDSEFTRTQIGLLVLRGPAGQCRAYKYDNLTGEAFPASEPCQLTAQLELEHRIIGDSGGSPRQLEALSKYFSQR